MTRTTTMPRREGDPLVRQPQTGGPGQVTVTVIACLMILVVFVVIAALV